MTKAIPARILIVEDEQIPALDLSQTLEELGYEVAAIASCASEGFESARIAEPDLVLMDINLPGGMDGVQAAAQMRSEFGIPVVFITAYDDPATLSRAKIAEPFSYLCKPFNARELHANIEITLYRHAMERERARMKAELEAALAEISNLRSILPICAKCKKIREDDGEWEPIEAYIQQRTGTRFSHSYCPDCQEAFLRELRSPSAAKASEGEDLRAGE